MLKLNIDGMNTAFNESGRQAMTAAQPPLREARTYGHGKNSARRRNADFDAWYDATRRRATQGSTQNDANSDACRAARDIDVR